MSGNLATITGGQDICRTTTRRSGVRFGSGISTDSHRPELSNWRRCGSTHENPQASPDANSLKFKINSPISRDIPLLARAERPTPAHALTEAKRARDLAVTSEPRFADRPPSRIVPTLADDERIKRAARTARPPRANPSQGRAQTPQCSARRSRIWPPCRGLGRVWSWDITCLPT